MTDQPYEGQYPQGYDPYQQQPPQQDWPARQQPYGYEDPQAHLQHTQQWQGQTWETSVQPPVTAADPAETAYLPPQTGETPAWQQQAPAYQQPRYQEPRYQQAQHQQHGSAQQGQYQASYGQQVPYGRQAGHAAAPAPVAPEVTPEAMPEGEVGGPAYGPATMAGNARITDAQRARLEGRSPVIEPGMQPAALTALLGLLLSGTAAIGTYALVVPLVVLQAVTAAGWFRLNGMWPARQGIALAFLGALVSDVALLVAGRENAPAAILGSLGVWVLLCLVLQLRSHADPDERMYGLMATVTSAALAILATGHLGADPDAVTVGAAAVAVAVLARALPLPTPASVVVALLAAAGAGIAVGGMTALGAKGALLGAGAAVCALIGHRVASYDYPSRFVHFTAGVALPLAAAAPAVYVLGRALG
ncbi:hypothetical protein NFX46_38350 [Streptomyces phaeoluteigriseus]|uniref:Membrane protein YfcA n=1 Tax=Streptomyces phaeoluteigriseus TaxID=114686 RepID=A0ABY4ZJ13_9ACTN|nr:hypothetical protein [Streptomyces phaeoluteigriseus]USQ89098.1 hypothetical protein NFX46_38350 [Streptomyces phaeoluteigriseus]